MTEEILVVGSLNMDLVVRTPRHPKIGETILGSDFRTFPGGKGANQAVAASRLGGRVAMIGRVGADDFGESLLNTVQQDGVDIRCIRKDPGAATGVALITVDEAGKNTIVVASGANSKVNPQDVQDAAELFKRGGVLLLQLECPLDAVREAVHLANRQGMKVVLNPAPAQPLDPDLLSGVDVLIPNQTELALLSGKEDLHEGLEVLRSWNVKQVIVTLGEDGVLIAGEKSEEQIPAYQVEVIDTTAAGDAFAGAFAVALSEGLDIYQAARWGNASGALTVTRAGAQPSLPDRQTFDAFLSERR